MSVGLKRGTVKLSSRHKAWHQLFLSERRRLQRAFGKVILDIEHIGSTAIPDVPAKPIIDMAVGVRTLATAQRMTRTFARLGYEHRGKQGARGRELFVKGPEQRRTHHAHVTRYGSTFWRDHLHFRDYLRTQKRAAVQYTRLKRGLAAKHPNSRRDYTKGKAKFIAKIIQVASKKGRKVRS